MKAALIVGLSAALIACAHGDAPSEEHNFSAEFGPYSGSFSLYAAAARRWVRYHPADCRVRTTPCSTFKVLNALIALDTGIAASPDFAIPWDGRHYAIEDWNRDQTLRSAFSASCLWYFEILAARIGMPRLQKYISDVGYGNGDASGGLPHFWIEGSLTISPDEQVDFLRRLDARELPFSSKTVDAVLDIMTLSRSGLTVFRGKTGTAGDAVKNVATLGWFIGSASTPSGDYFFATRISRGENPSGRTARRITESILSQLKILP